MKMGKWPTFILPLQDEFQNFHIVHSPHKAEGFVKTSVTWRVKKWSTTHTITGVHSTVIFGSHLYG